jgi:hypothetical protein
MTEGSDDSDLYRRHESTVERAVSHSGLAGPIGRTCPRTRGYVS